MMNWNLLRQALRTEPAVSIAVVFGSIARGDDNQDSDVDLMIGLHDPGLGNRIAVIERLSKRTRLPLDVVELEDALRRPALMTEIIRDGRVLIDRDDDWPKLSARVGHFDAQAHDHRQLLANRARDAVEMFAARASASR